MKKELQKLENNEKISCYEGYESSYSFKVLNSFNAELQLKMHILNINSVIKKMTGK